MSDGGSGQFQFTNFSNAIGIGAAAMGVGIAQGAFDLALTYSKQ